MNQRFEIDLQKARKWPRLPCLLLIQPAISWVLLLANDNSTSNCSAWVGPIGNILTLVAGVCLLYPIAVSIAADRLSNHPLRMLALFRPGLTLTVWLGAAVLFLQPMVLAAAALLRLGDNGWFISAPVALGGFCGLIILLDNNFERRPNLTQGFPSVLIDVADHPELDRRLTRLCADLNVGLPKNVLVGRAAELSSTPETVICWDGEITGGVLNIPLTTCQLLNHSEFDAIVAVELVRLKGAMGGASLEFRERLRGAVAAAQDVETTKNAWRWFPPRISHPLPMLGLAAAPMLPWMVLIVLARLAIVALVRMCIVLGAEWFGFFVGAFQRAAAEMAQRSNHRAAIASVRLYGAQWYVSALEKEAALSLCTHYRLAGEHGAHHRLGEIILSLQKPILVRPMRPSPWRNPLFAWQILLDRCAAFGVSIDWCHRLAMDVEPKPSAASLFSGLEALSLRLTQADQKACLPEDTRTREKRPNFSFLKL